MNRLEQLRRLEATNEPWDLVVIGGGASGLGIAVDAASRGYRVALFEAHDFAKGTSGRSTKLVHGGVRYLAQGRVRLVREALRERGNLERNAAHLVSDLAFIIPVYHWWEKAFYRFGLGLYGILGGHQAGQGTRTMDRSATLERLPHIRPAGLRGGVCYHDGRFDDARLAVELARTAVDHSACVLNHTPVIALRKDDAGRLNGVRVKDALTGKEIEVASRCVVNATGVFTAPVLAMDGSDSGHAHVVPSQGVHLVLDRSFFSGTDALLVPRTSDGRVLFLVPWNGAVVVGTTDTPVKDAVLEPAPLEEEIDFILDTAGRYLARKPTRTDVRCMYAGLRPLSAPAHARRRTREISRGHQVLTAPSGLISIVGGKWTTYRRMAEDTVDRAIAVAGLAPRPCITAALPIHGNLPTAHLDRQDPLHRYGSAAPIVRSLQQADPSLAERLHPDHPFTFAEVAHAVRHEMAMTVEDVLARRVRLLFHDARAAMECTEQVARVMTREAQKDEAWVQEQVDAFRALAKKYLPSEK